MTPRSVTGRAFTAQLKALLQRTATTSNMTLNHWSTLAEEFGPEIYSEALYRLARLELAPEQARDCLLAIVAHQGLLSSTLRRNVSLLTATCDYFMQVEPMVREPVLLEVRLLQQKEEHAERDELTGLLNRRAFNQELPREMERFRRFGHCFTLLMLDVDHFKEFNDAHGHSAGDQALCDVGAVLTETARLYDRVVRYGGEEFALILPQTSGEESLAVAERIREAIARHHMIFCDQDLGVITASIGLACYPNDGLDMKGLVESADKALYGAKEQRDCVRQYHDSKRNHRRFALTTPLPLALHAPQLGKVMASAWDVSFGGLRCSADSALPPATVLHLVLSDMERSIHLPLLAEVRRLDATGNDTYQMGLAFRLESVEDQMKLVALLDGHLTPSGHVDDAKPAAPRPDSCKRKDTARKPPADA